MTFATIDYPATIQEESWYAAPARAVRGGFVIRPIVSANLLRVAMTGFWTQETLFDFAKAMQPALQGLKVPREEHLLLLDTSEAPIQSQQTCAVFRTFLENPQSRPKRLALVAGNGAGRMQARRLLNNLPDTAIFEDENSALRWLVGRAA